MCASHTERARAVAKEHGIAAGVADVAELCARDDVDVVSVASPPHVHRDHVMTALAAGKHVLCEKPFASDAGEAREMLAAAERAGVVHAIDHEFRYAPGRARVKELLEGDAIGTPRLALVMEMTGTLVDPSRPRQEWWLRRELSGGLLGALGSHWIDSLIWWLGDVERVSAELAISTPTRPTTDGGTVDVTADDTAQLLLRLRGGAIATVQLSSAVHHPSRRVILYGSGGSLVLGGDGRVMLARGSQEVMDAAYRSAEVGGPVAVAN